jgi:chromosome segregation ATPase
LIVSEHLLLVEYKNGGIVMTKKEYKLSVEGQKEVDFVNDVAARANKMANVAVAVSVEKGKYDDKNKVVIESFRQDVETVSEKYQGNVAELEQTKTDLNESRKQVVTHYNTSVHLRERVKKEVANAKTLEDRLETATAKVEALTTERDNAVSQYGSEKDKRKSYEAQLERTNKNLTSVSGELSSTKTDLTAALVNVDGLSTRATTRTSTVQTWLQKYFAVPESEFKGVADNKREEHAYKLLEEKLAERASSDKKVEDELNAVLSGTKPTDKKPTNGGSNGDSKVVNRVKAVTPAGRYDKK